MWHVTYDMWHLTSDMWHLTRDRWQVGGVEPSLNISAERSVNKKQAGFIKSLMMSNLICSKMCRKMCFNLYPCFYEKTYISDCDISCQKLLEKWEANGTEFKSRQKPLISLLFYQVVPHFYKKIIHIFVFFFFFSKWAQLYLHICFYANLSKCL